MSEKLKRSTKHKRDIPHPAFPQPKNARVKVWKYLTLSKFLALLTKQALPLIRADHLGDEFEGSIPASFSKKVLRAFVNEFLRVETEARAAGKIPE
jgi:hypothetical protein